MSYYGDAVETLRKEWGHNLDDALSVADSLQLQDISDLLDTIGEFGVSMQRLRELAHNVKLAQAYESADSNSAGDA